MSYLKPVVVASTMLVAILSAPAFADHVNSAQPQTVDNIAMTAGRNSPKSDVSYFNWGKRLFVGGLLNVDTVYSERGWADPSASLLGGASDFETPPFSSHSVHGSDIVINNANLFFDAKVNDATTAHVGLAYVQRPGEIGSSDSLLEGLPGALFGALGGNISNIDVDDLGELISSGAVNVAAPADLGVDEAYITFHDCASPFYLQAGKKFTSFGTYNPYPITYSLTQLLAQTNEEVLEFGYLGNEGINASVYAFNGPFSGRVSNARNLTSRINNYGIDVGYAAQYESVNYNLNVGYVKDIRDSSFLSHRIANNLALIGLSVGTPDVAITSRTAGAYSLRGAVNSGPLVLSADYVAVTRKLFDISSVVPVSGLDSRVWAYGLAAGYGFDSMGYASKATLGYQRAGNASLLNMPRYRLLADYTVEVSKNAKVSVEYVHSKAYKAGEYNAVYPTATTSPMLKLPRANSNATNTATLRLSVSL